MRPVRHVAGQADERPGGEQQEDIGRLDAHHASAEIGLEEAAAERILVRLDRLVGENEAADGEEQVDAERRHLQMRLQRRAAERVAITGEKARRPLQRMAENDEGDGEETQPVDLRAVGALRDLALEPGREIPPPRRARRRSIWIRPRTSRQLCALPQGRDYAKSGVIGGLSRSHRGRLDEGDQRAHRRPGVDDRHAGAAARGDPVSASRFAPHRGRRPRSAAPPVPAAAAGAP